MELRILLAMAGLFALLSGWLKSRARVREYMGGAGLGPLEILVGFSLFIAQGPGMAADAARVALGWATGALLAVSNVYALLRARRVTRRRLRSEGRRLYTEVQFRSALEDAGLEEEEGAGRPERSPPEQTS